MQATSSIQSPWNRQTTQTISILKSLLKKYNLEVPSFFESLEHKMAQERDSISSISNVAYNIVHNLALPFNIATESLLLKVSDTNERSQIITDSFTINFLINRYLDLILGYIEGGLLTLENKLKEATAISPEEKKLLENQVVTLENSVKKLNMEKEALEKERALWLSEREVLKRAILECEKALTVAQRAEKDAHKSLLLKQSENTRLANELESISKLIMEQKTQSMSNLNIVTTVEFNLLASYPMTICKYSRPIERSLDTKSIAFFSADSLALPLNVYEQSEDFPKILEVIQINLNIDGNYSHELPKNIPSCSQCTALCTRAIKIQKGIPLSDTGVSNPQLISVCMAYIYDLVLTTNGVHVLKRFLAPSDPQGKKSSLRKDFLQSVFTPDLIGKIYSTTGGRENLLLILRYIAQDDMNTIMIVLKQSKVANEKYFPFLTDLLTLPFDLKSLKQIFGFLLVSFENLLALEFPSKQNIFEIPDLQLIIAFAYTHAMPSLALLSCYLKQIFEKPQFHNILKIWLSSNYVLAEAKLSIVKQFALCLPELVETNSGNALNVYYLLENYSSVEAIIEQISFCFPKWVKQDKIVNTFLIKLLYERPPISVFDASPLEKTMKGYALPLLVNYRTHVLKASDIMQKSSMTAMSLALLSLAGDAFPRCYTFPSFQKIAERICGMSFKASSVFFTHINNVSPMGILYLDYQYAMNVPFVVKMHEIYFAKNGMAPFKKIGTLVSGPLSDNQVGISFVNTELDAALAILTPEQKFLEITNLFKGTAPRVVDLIRLFRLLSDSFDSPKTLEVLFSESGLSRLEIFFGSIVTQEEVQAAQKFICHIISQLNRVRKALPNSNLCPLTNMLLKQKTPSLSSFLVSYVESFFVDDSKIRLYQPDIQDLVISVLRSERIDSNQRRQLLQKFVGFAFPSTIDDCRFDTQKVVFVMGIIVKVLEGKPLQEGTHDYFLAVEICQFIVPYNDRYGDLFYSTILTELPDMQYIWKAALTECSNKKSLSSSPTVYFHT